MATIKHISSKNADYSAAEHYLIFQHDEYRNIPLLDAQGRKMLREEFLVGTLECGDEDFAMACVRANRKFGKNDRRDEVKSHHYIISFDPRDRDDHGLTLEKAHRLGMEFCAKNFPGHPAIIAAHPDGHSGSGNIHVHIVINSLRVREIEREPWMDKACDWEAGMKHRCTSKMLRHLRCEVMEMCQREGLYQIDLLGGRKDRITEREYWAQTRGQKQLDKKNAELIADGVLPVQTKFETDKQVLRNQIRACMAEAQSFEEFSALLSHRFGVAVKESRGRFSYIPVDRVKAITARMLGDDFSKEAVLAALDTNARQPGKSAVQVPSFREKPAGLRPNDGVQKLIDIQTLVERGKGQGCIQWAKVFNVKQIAESMLILSRYGIGSEGQLEEAVLNAGTARRESAEALKNLDQKLRENQELMQHAMNFRRYRSLTGEAKTARHPDCFREQHRTELAYYDAAVRYFRRKNIRRLPAAADLQNRREQLLSEKNAVYQRYQVEKQAFRELSTVKVVMQTVLRTEERAVGRNERHKEIAV